MSERLQNKMYDYEVTPPANLWEKIAVELDESELTHEFPSKLYEIEIIPPHSAWNKINTSLSLDAEEVESPKRKKVFAIFHYAAAAAVIVVELQLAVVEAQVRPVRAVRRHRAEQVHQ